MMTWLMAAASCRVASRIWLLTYGHLRSLHRQCGSRFAPTWDLCCSGDQVASVCGYLCREPSNHSMAVRQMQIPRKYADISSQRPITSGLITGWLITSDKLHSNQMAVTAMLIGMNLRTRNGCRNFIRVTVSSARPMTVSSVTHGDGAMMYRHNATTFHAAG